MSRNRRIAEGAVINLGLGWDQYSATTEQDDHQANMVGGGARNGPGGTFFIPKSTCSQVPPAFVAQLGKDGIALDCTGSRGVMDVQHLNFAPRVSFAYQVWPSCVVRGGYGIAFGSLGNIGAAP